MQDGEIIEDYGPSMSRAEYKAWTNFLDYLIADYDASVADESKLINYYSRKANQHRLESIKYFTEMRYNA